MQTERDRKRTRVSVMKLIYCSAISGFFLTLQHHIPRYAEQFPMFFGEGIPFPTYRFLPNSLFRWLLTLCHLKIRFEQTAVGVLYMT